MRLLRKTVRAWMMVVGVVVVAGANASAAERLKALIVDGQNNHQWQSTTPLLKKALEASGRFTVEVATSPPAKADMSKFRPQFAGYDVVVSNYNGDPWSPETRQDFVEYVRGGGGFVVVHAANNAFGDWKEYNEIIGLGGWGGRNEKSGPYVFFRDDQRVEDASPGGGGSHGAQHEFEIVVRNADHPVTKGMPRAWLHAKDELYDRLRGPASNMNILATAYSDKGQGGAGRHEPMIFTIDYGKGRVFHTPMGHADYSMKCVGFITTLQRGAEWAATGNVTVPIPADFPTGDKVSARE